MLASSAMTPATTGFSIKQAPEERECSNSTPPPVESVSPKSADDSHYTATSSPSSTINTNINNSNGNNNTGVSRINGTHSIACSSTTSSSGPMAMESPQSSTETSQRTSFDFNSLFNNAPLNNNDKSSNFDFGLQFGLSNNNDLQQQPATPNPFTDPFSGLPFAGLDPTAIMQLSQMLGNSPQHTTVQPNAKQQLDATLLHQQLQQASESQKPNSLSSFVNSNRAGRLNSAANGPTTPNDANADRKRSYPYTFQYCVLCKKNVHSSKLPCHIRQCHVMKPMFQCPSCDFTSTYSKNNVKSHMVSLHGLAGEPISYMDQYAGRVEEFMKKCFPNVRGRGRPVHGRNSPRSPSSPMMQNDQLGSANRSMNNLRQNSASRNQRQQRNSNTMQGQISQMPAANRLGEMFAMLNQQKQNHDKIDPLLPMNPFAYFQNFKYMRSDFMKPCQREKVDQGSKERQWKKKLREQISMEQLLQNFGTNINASYTAQHNTKSSPEDNPPVSAESTTTESKQQATEVEEDEDEVQRSFEPHYLPRNLKLCALSRNQIPSTVFSTFTNNSTELVEQLELSHEFESLINENTSLLTRDQTEKVAEVRKKLQLQAFEVMFAVHRLDLDVLPLPKLGLVSAIAPTEVDIRRFALFELSNNMRNLSDDEQFVVQLSKVERLREKLAIMRLMGTFDQSVQKIGQTLHDLNMAAKLLQNSSDFHTIVQLLLICANVINGDLNSELIVGFRTSSIVDICAFKFPNGLSLLELLATRIDRKFPELKSFVTHYAIIEAAANTDFANTLKEIRRLEQAKNRVEAELNTVESNETLIEFMRRAENELAQLNESAQITKGQLHMMLEFFGESVELKSGEKPLRPEQFFRKIAEFSRNFQAIFCCI